MSSRPGFSVSLALAFFILSAQGTIAQSQGPRNPGTTANDAAVGTTNWTNPGNGTASDNTYATVSTKGISRYLKTTNFGFTLPTSTAIAGVVVEVERSSTATVSLLNGWATGLTRSITAAPNRCVVVTYAQENGYNSRDITAMTYGGRAMTEVAQQTAGTTNDFLARLEVWILLEADIALASSTTIVPTYGAYTAVEYCEAFSSAVFSNVDQTTPIGSLRTTGASNPPSTANPHQLGATLATQAGNMAVNLVTEGNNTTPASTSGGTGTYTINSGYTEGTDLYFANATVPTSGACFQTGHKAITVSGTEQPSCTFNGTVNRWAMIGFTLNRMPELDHRVQLVKGGSIVSSNKANTTPWPFVDAYANYGSGSDLWGTSWSTADINSSGFGTAIAARVQNGTARVDHMRMTVYYYSTLPVELMYFRAVQNGANVNMEWATATERDTHYFVVERSSDALGFEEVARVEAAGNSQQALFYRADDLHPLEGTSYYRLVQVDTDGSTDISPVVALSRVQTAWSIFPNPTDGRLTILDPEARSFTVSVYDATMRIVKSATVLPTDPVLLLNELPDGEYTLLIRTGEEQRASRIAKTSRTR